MRPYWCFYLLDSPKKTYQKERMTTNSYLGSKITLARAIRGLIKGQECRAFNSADLSKLTCMLVAMHVRRADRGHPVSTCGYER